MRSASGPKRSRSRCSSSTRVRSGASLTKRTSTLVTSDGSYFHSALICHVTTNRSGGSQTATYPVDVSLPSVWRGGSRPPPPGPVTVCPYGPPPAGGGLGAPPPPPRGKDPHRPP